MSLAKGCSASTSGATSARAVVMVRSLGEDPRQRAAMQQIADWLEKLGMSEYAQHFAENRIDFSVLPDLTDQHLKDLGIALGDRLKMLRAIRELGATPASAQAAQLVTPALTTTSVYESVSEFNTLGFLSRQTG
jgi:hypothetical protein